MTTPVLELKDVNKAFGGVQAVRDMSFAIGSGELAGLIGPNGAGKTTIFNLVTGVYDVTSGAISFKGQSLNKLKTYQVIRLGIARTFGGTVMIGAAHENMGMDRRLTPEVLAANAQWAVRVWPELERKRILRFWTGLRVWPKDAYPIYDRIPGHENAFVFAMHSAVSLAAILEQALPDYVMGKPLPPDGAIFGLSRFAGGASGFQGSAASSPHAEAPNK